MAEPTHSRQKNARQAARDDSLPVRLEHNLESAKETVAKLDSGIRRFAAREPMIAAIGALGVGFMLGRLFSKA